VSLFDLKEMKWFKDKTRKIEHFCDEGIGGAPIVDGQEAFFLGNGHISILDLEHNKITPIFY